MKKSEIIHKNVTVYDVAQKLGIELRESIKGEVWMGRCPLGSHKDDTPSFQVKRETFHCFGACKAHGDSINLVESMMGLNTSEAMDWIIEEFSLKAPAQRKKVDPYFQATSKLQAFYRAGLDQAAQSYLRSRGLRPETINELGIGFCPRVHSLAEVERVVSSKKLLDWGLAADKDGRLYSPLWGRIIFPINVPGQKYPLSFAGRALGEMTAKYKLSRNSSYFERAENVYGLDQAAPEIRKANQVIIVEGFFDRVMMHQSGYRNCVATFGSEVTEAQIKLLARYTTNFLFLMDGDDGGDTGARRAAELCLLSGLRAEIAFLPRSMDPGALLKSEEGKRLVSEAVEASTEALKHIVEWMIEFKAPIEVAAWAKEFPMGCPDLIVRSILKKRIESLLS